MAFPTLPAPAPVSPLDAAQGAVAHVGRHLFPFRFERWIVFGLAAFLDQCGRRAGVGGINVPSGPGGFGRDGGDFSKGVEWLAGHVAMVAVIAAVVLALAVAVIALVLFLNSRGVFIYLDAVATGRAEVGRPWREHAQRAASYFSWSFGLALASLIGIVVAVTAGAAVAVSALRRGGLDAVGVVLLIALVLGLLAFLFAASLASVALRDFVAPLQLAGGGPCGQAVRVFFGLVRTYPGPFLLYLLLKVVFSLVLGLGMVVAACCTCCCALLPVVSQTVFQPAFFFERAWPLYLLRQMGYDVLGPFAVVEPAAPGQGPAAITPSTSG